MIGTLLEPSSFGGTPHAAPGRREAFVGQSRFDGGVVVGWWPRAQVAALLPAELSLAPRADAADDRHPILVVLGTQADGVVRFAGVAWPGGPDYQEVAIAVPFVTRRDGHALHLYMARMYASYPPAVWAGNVYYGFSKTLASVAWDGTCCAVRARDGGVLLDATVRPHAGDGAGPFEPVRRLFLLPVLGRRQDRTLTCSRFDWDAREASIRSATARLALAPAESRGAAADVPAAAAFSVRGLRWQLTWPGRCAG